MAAAAGCSPIATATLFSTSLSLSPSIYTTTVIRPATQGGGGGGNDDEELITQVQTATSLVPTSRLIPTATLFTTPACDSRSEVEVGGTTRVPVSRASPSLRASATGTQTLTTALTVAGGVNQTPSVVVVTLTQTLSQTSATLVIATAEAPPPDPALATSSGAGGSSSSSSRSNKAAPIAGGIVGLVVALAAIAALLLWLRKRARRSRDTRALNDFFNAGAGVGRSMSQRGPGGAGGAAAGSDDDEDGDDDSGASSSGKIAGRRPVTPGLELERRDDDEDEAQLGEAQLGEAPLWSREMTEQQQQQQQQQQGQAGWGAHGRTSVVMPSPDGIVYDAAGRPISIHGRPISPTMVMAPRSLSPVQMATAVAPRSMSPVHMRPASPSHMMGEARPASIHDTLLMREQSSRSVNSQESRHSLVVGSSPMALDTPSSLNGAPPLSHASTPMLQRSAPTSPELGAVAVFGAIGGGNGQSRSLGRNFTVSSTGGRFSSRVPLGMTVMTGGVVDGRTRPNRSESTGSMDRPRNVAGAGGATSPVSPLSGAPAPFHRSPRHSHSMMSQSQELPPMSTGFVASPRSHRHQPSPPFSASRIVGGTATGGAGAGAGSDYPPSRYAHLDVGYPISSESTADSKRSPSTNLPLSAATPTLTPSSLPVSANGSSQGVVSSSSTSLDSPADTPALATSRPLESSSSQSSLQAMAIYHSSLVKEASEQLVAVSYSSSSLDAAAAAAAVDKQVAPPPTTTRSDGDAEEQRRLERLAAAKLWGLSGALRVANGEAVQTPE